MNKLQELTKLGQSIWLDYIRRSFIASGELKNLIDEGVRGVTSNPTIFEKAIAGSSDYDEQLSKLAGSTLDEMYEALVLEDIRRTAELLRPVWDSSAGADGYVSLEVSPELARDTKGTIEEARRLFKTLDKPNVMIKVPATKEGIPAIEALIAEGINVNATLIFSLHHYETVAEAYLAGLEKLAGGGGDLGRVASVASFFVSRVDTAVDKALEELGEEELKGKIAIANTKASFLRSRKLYSGERWRKLAAGGARVQRLLWASTGTKDPSYPDTLYLDNLIGPDTVNTVPPATLDAFRDHGNVSSSLDTKLEQAGERLEQLNRLGVDLEAITEKLQEDGVAAFAKSFQSLRRAIVEKAKVLGGGREMLQVSLGAYQQAVDTALEEMAAQRVMQRIWSHDHTVWKTEPTGIDNRLGWLTIAETSKKNIGKLTGLADELRASGYRQAVLLGMGGSSLAPEVFSKTFGPAEGYLKLSVIDSTDPDLILSYAEELDLNKTLFIVSTKSGGTVETLSFFKYFYNRSADTVGADRVGEHFVAITDPGSKLADLAARYSFRTTFLNDPNIGGRYSALSYFGLLPAALLGIDLELLLDRALAAAREGADGARLGAILGRLAIEKREGFRRDKVTIFTSSRLASFGDWVEQLIAESTGKEGKGIVPVIGEPLGAPEVYGRDRLFVHLRLQGEGDLDAGVEALEKAGHPVIRIDLRDLYDLGAQFFLWEMATAVAGHLLGINPFDQPNVESAKVRARQMMSAYTETGKLPEDRAEPPDGKVVEKFLSKAGPGDYVALQAYVQPTETTSAVLQELRTRIRDRYRVATTVGYGPRFLHSTGQLHKGGGAGGLFLQFTSSERRDVAIPDTAGKQESAVGFAALKMAQALGDKRALEDNRRRVIRIHLGRDVDAAIRGLMPVIGS